MRDIRRASQSRMKHIDGSGDKGNQRTREHGARPFFLVFESEARDNDHAENMDDYVCLEKTNMLSEEPSRGE